MNGAIATLNIRPIVSGVTRHSVTQTKVVDVGVSAVASAMGTGRFGEESRWKSLVSRTHLGCVTN